MNKKLIKIILAAVGAVALIAIAFTVVRIIRDNSKYYDTYTIKAEMDLKSGGGANFIVSEKNVVRYTRDGISAYNEKGNEIWNVSYQMNTPIVDVCGDYAAVADKGSDNFYILDNKGTVHNYTSEHKIVLVSVGGKGITAVWMDDGLKDYITVYDIDGNKLVDMMTTTEDNGFPVAIDVSKDGTKLVTSYAQYKDNDLKNQLTFYNFGETGSNYVDRLVGLKIYTDRLCPVVRFVNNDKVAAFSEKGIDLFDMDVKEEEAGSIEITETIEQISTDSTHIGVITTDTSGVRMLHVYDLKGKEISKKEMESAYKHFLIRNKEVILYGGTELFITRIEGKDKAKVTMSMDISGIIPVDGRKKYVVVGENKLETIELAAVKEKE